MVHINLPCGRIDQKRECYYAYTQVKGRTIYLHRFIMDAPKGVQVDHRDGDGLNNLRGNLRFATQTLNNANRAYRGTTGFRGVVLTSGGRYRAAIFHRENGRRTIKNLGTYEAAEEAARAYDDAALERFGEFARLNFPEAA